MTTKEEVLRLAEEASSMVVDWDLRGNPITEAHVVMMGAYGPFMMRFYELAKAQGAAEERTLSYEREKEIVRLACLAAADQAREHQKEIEAIRNRERNNGTGNQLFTAE